MLIHLWRLWVGAGTRRPASQPRRCDASARRSLQMDELESRTLPSGTGLTAQYYANQNLTGLRITRTDAAVNFNWGNTQAPAPGVSHNHFSVRWTGYLLAPVTGTYVFSTVSDDGVRLMVGGTPLINNWTDHAATTNYATIHLVAGQKYSLEMDYYQDTGAAVAQLNWSLPGHARQIIPTSDLYPQTSTPVPPAPPANPPSHKDTAPPTASLAAPMLTVPGGHTYTFQVTYQDNTAVARAALHTGNILVTGPHTHQLATLCSVSPGGSSSRLVATYLITAPHGKWTSADDGTYTVTLEANQVRDTSGNFAHTAKLGTFRVTLAGDDPVGPSPHTPILNDPTLAGLVGTLDASGTLSRNDMLSIFSQVENQGTVTSAEVSDLKTIVNDATYLGIPPYVANLAAKVVYGDPANQTYQGHSLGKLHVGSSALQLKELVDKWFLGGDLPAIGGGLHYAVASGTLFGAGGPSYTDIVQGGVQDCFFLAALGEVALHSPATISQMFINNGDGTYTVRFFNNGHADYVTVNLELPADSNGDFAYANYGGSLSNPGNILWVGLAEKAYAELAASGWSRGSNLGNAYSSISVGWEGTAVMQLTGRNVSPQAIVNNAATFDSLISNFNANHMIGLDSNNTTTSGIVSRHVYFMVGYNSSTHLFSLYNPWGFTTQLSWGQIAANFSLGSLDA